MPQKESVTEVNSPDQYYWIGKSIPKPDSMEKAMGDIRGTALYRRAMIAVLVRRTLERSIERAKRRGHK